MDQSGKPLAGLNAADFNLEDAGISCEIVGVEAASYPLAVILDTSSYARSDFRALQTAVEEFVQAVPAREMAVYAGGATPSIVQDFTRDRSRVVRAIASEVAAPNGSTHTLEMIVRASHDLAERKSPIGGVVAISAGGIEMNPPGARLALQTLLSNNTILNVIEQRSLRLEQGAAQTDQGDIFRNLAARAHGRYFGGAGPAVYQAGLAGIAQQLGSQVILEYIAPPGAKEGLSVRVKPPGVVVMALQLQ